MVNGINDRPVNTVKKKGSLCINAAEFESSLESEEKGFGQETSVFVKSLRIQSCEILAVISGDFKRGGRRSIRESQSARQSN